MRYVAEGEPWLLERTIEYLSLSHASWRDRGYGGFAVTTESGDPIGEGSLLFFAGAATIELGYTIATAHCGRGFGTETARELRRLAFETIGASRVFAVTDERNHPSARILKKLGFREESPRDVHGTPHRFFVCDRGYVVPRGRGRASICGSYKANPLRPAAFTR